MLKYIIAFIVGAGCLVYLLNQEHLSILTFLSGYIAFASLSTLLIRRLSMKFKVALGATLLTILALEISFRIFMFPTLASHAELGSTERIRKYVSVYDQGDSKHIYEGLKNWVYCFTRMEYEHCREYNEYGIPHREPIDPSKPNILFMGDSFTEGHGTHQDSTYVTEMSRLFKHQFNCINAGMGGSDPFYAWKLYEDKLKPLQPRVFVLTIATNDILDVVLRDGDDRFLDYKGQGKGPWWEPVYGSSYLLRFVLMKMGYTWFLRSKERTRRDIQHAINLTRAKINGMYELFTWQGVDFFVVLHPEMTECYSGEYGYSDFLEVVEDLPPERVINTMDEFKARGCDGLYWPADRHFNKKGYFLLADLAYHQMHDVLRASLNEGKDSIP